MRSVVITSLAMIAAGVVIAALAIAFGSCGSGDNIDREALTIITANDTTARLEVEIADTAEERTKGLSGRSEIPLDTGMLFVIPQRGPGFWMKDTLVDLSVAFIAHCGEIVDIQDMQANTLDLHNTDKPYGFGLETAQGWFSQNGIAAGDRVVLPDEVRPDDC